MLCSSEDECAFDFGLHVLFGVCVCVCMCVISVWQQEVEGRMQKGENEKVKSGRWQADQRVA